MNVLEKIFEELEERGNIQFSSYTKPLIAVEDVLEIIRSHMDDGKDTNVPSNSGWILCSERLPKVGKLVSVTIHSSEFISNYHDDWVDDENKIYYPEEYFTSIGWICSNGRWKYLDECNSEVSCSEKFGDDKGSIYDVVIAWQPLPKSYKAKK